MAECVECGDDVEQDEICGECGACAGCCECDPGDADFPDSDRWHPSELGEED